MSKPHLGQISLPLQARPGLQALGERMAIARKRRKLTQSQVSRLAGLSRLSVINIERGRPTINLKKFIAIAFLFNLEAEWEFFTARDRPAAGQPILTREDEIQALALGLGKKIRSLRKKKP